MRKMPAGSNGGETTDEFAEEEHAFTRVIGCGISSALAKGGETCAADDDPVEGPAGEQGLLELMVALTLSEEEGLEETWEHDAELIAQRIVTREEELRTAFAEHLGRLRAGAQSVAVCVFDCSTSETKRICPPATAYILTGGGATFLHYRREVLADLKEDEMGESLEMRLADIFSPDVCSTRLKWAGPTVRLVRHTSSSGLPEPQFIAMLNVCDDRPCEPEVLQVMLKSHNGAYARTQIEPGCGESELRGNALPGAWEELLLGFAVGNGLSAQRPSLYRRRVTSRNAMCVYPPAERPADTTRSYCGEGMATRVAEC